VPTATAWSLAIRFAQWSSTRAALPQALPWIASDSESEIRAARAPRATRELEVRARAWPSVPLPAAAPLLPQRTQCLKLPVYPSWSVQLQVGRTCQCWAGICRGGDPATLQGRVAHTRGLAAAAAVFFSSRSRARRWLQPQPPLPRGRRPGPAVLWQEAMRGSAARIDSSAQKPTGVLDPTSQPPTVTL
jgi:hypothetical protein